MTDTISISFNCKVCGAKLVWDDDIADNAPLNCKSCGEYFGTYMDLKETAMKAARDRVEEIIRDAFRRR